MKKSGDSGQVFSRRAFVLGALQLSALCVLGGRLAWLQVAQGQKYKTLSDKNRINIKMIAPSRGQIVDRFGIPLAVNNQNFRVLVVPEQAEDLEKVLFALKKLVRLSDDDIQTVLKRASKTAKFVPLEVRDDLTWQEVAKIEVNLPDLPGLSIDEGEIRSYPYGEATAHVVGYVGAVSKTDLSDDPVLTLPGFKVGKTGIEKQYDEQMRGRPGTSEVEINVVGREVRELVNNPSTTGDNVALTIDISLQQSMQRRLNKERSASAVVMDVRNGAVYALASSPSFDPNLFTRGLSVSMWEELLANPGYPLTNKAIAGHYPPGSTFKMITALAGLEAGVINKHSTAYCPGHYEYGDDRFHCWKSAGHGTVDLVSALSESCDTYFYKYSTDIGIDRIAAMARRFGLGDVLDFDLNGERPGLMPDKDWKMGHLGEYWRPGETIVASIGQSYIQTTPLQLAVMTARMVNGGYAVKPWITAQIGNKRFVHDKWPEMSIKKAHLDLVLKGMDEAVNDKNGTAKGSRIEDPGMAMGGKTGTAQVQRITMKQRREGAVNADLPWKMRHHALFVGYAPVDNPVYACAVVVEHGVGGSVTAAPLAKDLLYEAQKRDPASRDINNVFSDVIARDNKGKR